MNTLPYGHSPINTKVLESDKSVFNDLSLFDIEKKIIIHRLTYFGNNKSRAAKSLGITVKTLQYRLHKYGLFEEFRKQGKPR